MTDSVFEFMRQGDTLKITAPHTLDAATQPHFSVALDQAIADDAKHIHLDLTATKFADSAGIGFISMLHKQCVSDGVGLKIIGASGQPLALLTSLKVGEHVEIET